MGSLIPYRLYFAGCNVRQIGQMPIKVIKAVLKYVVMQDQSPTNLDYVKVYWNTWADEFISLCRGEEQRNVVSASNCSYES